MKFSTIAILASAALAVAAPAPQEEEVSTVVEEVTSFYEVIVTVTGVEPTDITTVTPTVTTTTSAEETSTDLIPGYPDEEETIIPGYPEEDETTTTETVTATGIPIPTLETTTWPSLNSTVTPTYTINGTNPIITATPPVPTGTEVPPPSEGAGTVGRTVGLGAAAAGVLALVAGLF